MFQQAVDRLTVVVRCLEMSIRATHVDNCSTAPVNSAISRRAAEATVQNSVYAGNRHVKMVTTSVGHKNGRRRTKVSV